MNDTPSTSPHQEKIPGLHPRMLFFVITYLVLSSVVPLIIFGAVFFLVSRNNIKTQIEETSLQYARTEASRLGILMGNTNNLFINIASNIDLSELLDQSKNNPAFINNPNRTLLISRILTQYAQYNPVTAIDIFTAEGEHFSSQPITNEESITPKVINNLIIQTIASNHGMYWSGISEDYLHPDAKSRLTVLASYPFDETAAANSVFPGGIITITYPVEYFKLNKYNQNSESGNKFFLLDQKNEIVSSEDFSKIGTEYQLSDINEFTENAGVHTLPSNGVNQIVTFNKVEPYHWMVLNMIPSSAIDDQIRGVTFTILSLCFLTLLVILIISIYSGYLFIRPINQITFMFKAIQDGTFNWNTRLVPPRLAELGDLYNKFNGFLDNLQKNKAIESELRLSEARYHSLFDDSPIALWEEDFSIPVSELDRLRELGITQLPEYLQSHMEFAKSIFSKIRIIDVNQATLNQYHAENKADLINGFKTIIGDASEDLLIDQLQAIFEHRLKYEHTLVNYTLEGKPIDLVLRWTVAIGSEETFDRIFVNTMDITARMKDEKIQRAVYQISQAASTATHLEDMYRSIHKILSELMPAKNMYIALYDNQTDLVHYVYHVDEYDQRPDPVKLSRNLTGYVIRTGKPLLASPEEFDHLRKSGEIESQGAPSIDWLGVPLLTRDRIYGVIAVQTYHEGIRYTEEQKDILTFVSTQIAMAIERKQSEENLRYASTHDVITGIYNRAYFEEEVNRLSRGRQLPTSVVIVDVDGLKKVNDQYGHTAGDELIRTVASSLKSIFRGSDVVARFGGDEFGILLPFADERTVKKIINRVNEKIAIYNESSAIIKISLSLGYATVTDGNKLVEAINIADQNMYKEKQIKKLSLTKNRLDA